MALHTLKARQVLAATAGDLSDGGGLILRIGAGRASWCLRYSAPSGKRREMGLGLVARDSLALAGESLATAREKAKKARALLDNGIDPLAAREADKQAEREADAARKAEADRDHWTLARCARDYHERVIERTRTDKHSAQWISPRTSRPARLVACAHRSPHAPYAARSVRERAAARPRTPAR
jgi:Arm DNA-binding domain